MENENAREHRCVELTLSGHPCGRKAVAERDRCYTHGLYRDLDNGRATLDVPLLEDPASILFVLSQVARALAQGAIPAANANGIIRCCRVAQRLLEEQWKRERFEARQKKAGSRNQKSKDAATLPAEDLPHQADATTPTDLQHSADRPISDAPAPGDTSDPAGALQAASDTEPQPWKIEPPLPIVPPPQFADAPEKFRNALDRVNGRQFEAIRRRDRAIRARGGSALDFYDHHGAGVRNTIRDPRP